MSLSNTAVPIHYGKFRDAVNRGEIPVCTEIAMEMHRIDQLIADPRYYYDDKAIEGFIAYCENEATLANGQDLELLDSFKLWAESILSWYEIVERSVYVPSEDDHGGTWVQKRFKKRLRKKQYLIVARGGAKSMYASLLQSYFLNIDTSTTRQITTAPTMQQADEVMAPIRTSIIRSRGPFFKFLTQGSVHNTTGSRMDRQNLVATKKGVENFLTGSSLEVRPMAIDKLQGLNSKYNTVDEWLSGVVREDVIGALEQGASKDDQEYLIIAISSEGTVRNGVGDTIKVELLDILTSEMLIEPHVSIWHYKLDDIKEVSKPELWRKCNPNIGKTVQYDVYQRDVERMERAPATKNDILAKRFGIAVEGHSYFFTYEETIPSEYEDYRGMPCALGADLSQGDDFCAFTFLFPRARQQYFGIKTLSFITSNTYSKVPAGLLPLYEQFINEGTLIVLDGIVLDMEQVYDEVEKHIYTNDYDVRAFGYDPYNASGFVSNWIKTFGEYATEKVIQGARTESVPLGELKHLSEKDRLHFSEKIMSFAMGNAVVSEDTNGNRKLIKIRQDQKIDNFSALMDAYIIYKRYINDFD